MRRLSRSLRTGLVLLAAACATSCRTRPAPQPAPAPAADASPIYEHTIVAPLDATLVELREALRAKGFEIISESDTGLALAQFAKQWGDDFNRAGLDGIHSLSVCHPGYANLSSNADPTTLALCPLAITLFSKDDETTIVFVRPTAVAPNIPAARTLEQAVTHAVRTATAKHALAVARGECRFDFECQGDHVCDRHECLRWWQLHGDTPEVTAEELAAMVRDGSVQILDVRTAAEYRGGHIEGAHSVPLGQLEKRQHTLPVRREDEVVAVCLTAHRSVAAVRLLKRLGYEVVQLAGGMQAWRAASLPEVKGDAESAP